MNMLLPVILLWGMACADGMAQPASKFVIVTKERVGFSRGSEFYTLGTKLAEFRTKFGAAEKSVKDNDDEGYLAHTVTDYHGNDGFMVTARDDGIIIGFIFYPNASTTMKAAPVTTDRGIGAASTEKDVIKQYGEPYKREEYKDEQTLTLYYKVGELVLSFRFGKGVLKSIGLNGGYLPYLEKLGRR